MLEDNPNPASEKKLAAIFDLDGTFVDTADDLAAAMNFALSQQHMVPVAHGAVRGLVGFGALAMLSRGIEISAGRKAGSEELEQGVADFLQFYQGNIAVHSVPFEGAERLVERLRDSGWATAICTNKPEHLAVALIEALGLQALFDVIVGADTASAPKPDPAPVHLCLEKTGASGGVFFGDSDTDIRAADAAALPCLIAGFGYGPITLVQKCSAVFHRYDDVARHIDGLLKD